MGLFVGGLYRGLIDRDIRYIFFIFGKMGAYGLTQNCPYPVSFIEMFILFVALEFIDNSNILMSGMCKVFWI